MNSTLQDYGHTHKIGGLTEPSLKAIQEGRDRYSIDRGKQFLSFQSRIDRELLQHRVIVQNEFCQWFERGDLKLEQVRAFVVQFSVFSNLFLIAQLHKVINANSLEGMRASKEILANEIGVVFKSSKGRQADAQGVDPELANTEGSVEGGIFKFRAAHFEWLLQIAQQLDLSYDEVGKRRWGTPSTLHFCDELVRLYGSDDYEIGQAASYAVENWAAAGFWQQLVNGLKKFRDESCPGLSIAFFDYHNRIEAQHAAHTQEELEEYYFEHGDLNEDQFIRYGNEMLEGVAAFWDGLENQRKQLQS